MISQTAEYALRALAWLALNPAARAPASELAERVQAPIDYLAKVLQQLAAAGLVESKRGVGGGYRLALPPERIRLLDAVNAVAPIRRIEACPLGRAAAVSGLCPLHRTLDEAVGAALAVLDGATLASLLGAAASADAPLCVDRDRARRLPRQARGGD